MSNPKSCSCSEWQQSGLRLQHMGWLLEVGFGPGSEGAVLCDLSRRAVSAHVGCEPKPSKCCEVSNDRFRSAKFEKPNNQYCGILLMNDQSIQHLLRQLPSLKGPLPEEDINGLPSDPRIAFRLWLENAISSGIREPHAMTLSTVDADGQPDARVLILKNVDERGWHFAIKSASPKGNQIKKNANVALTFYWPELGRQIRIRGEALSLPADECAHDFSERPIGSKASAIASPQSQVLADETDLEERLHKAKEFLSKNPEHIETGWLVYAVSPQVIEFWQGTSDRNHKRLRFMRSNDGTSWSTDRLWP